MVPSSRVMEMTEIQAKKVSSFYISRGMIPEKDREIYDYCFEVLISTASTTAVILGISIAAGTVLRTLSYMAVFGMLKSSVGGYHARTHTGCLVRTVGTYAVYLALAPPPRRGDADADSAPDRVRCSGSLPARSGGNREQAAG